MYKHHSRPRRSSTSFRSTSALAGFVFFVLSIVAPAQTQKAETRIFSQGLKISLEKTSPAFAVLEDDLSSPSQSNNDFEQKTSEHEVQIFSGQSFVARAVQIIADNKKEEQLFVQQQMLKPKKVEVAEISRDELLQTLFLPIVTTLRKTPQLQTRKPIEKMNVAKYEVHKTDPAPILPKPSIVADVAQDSDDPHRIKGLLEFRNGLALTSAQDDLSVFQEVEGEKVQDGTVWVRQGRYSIEIPNRQGLLVAELRNPNGELLGRGELELANLPLQRRSQYKVNDVTIQLYPTMNGLTGVVLSAYSQGSNKKPVSLADVVLGGVGQQIKTEQNGSFEEKQTLEDSTLIAEVSHEGYWSSFAVVNSQLMNEITLYPNAMLKAFFSFVESINPEAKFSPEISLIWGKVTKYGQSVAGANVELMTTDNRIKPIYFNDLMIPDSKLEATSANGLYAFVPVPAGNHAVQVAYEDVISEPIVFPTQAKHVSNINIETVASKRIVVKSFDAFSPDTQIPSDLYRLGFESERTRSESGLADIKYSPNNNLLIINAVPQSNDYAPARVCVARNKDFAYLPMVKVSWLKSLIGAGRTPGTSIVVGFVKTNRPYQVFAGIAESANILYFDAQGKLLDGGLGMPGGGYVIFNMDPGFRTISVVPQGSEMVSAQTILADTNFVNLVNHSIQ